MLAAFTYKHIHTRSCLFLLYTGTVLIHVEGMLDHFGLNKKHFQLQYLQWTRNIIITILLISPFSHQNLQDVCNFMPFFLIFPWFFPFEGPIPILPHPGLLLPRRGRVGLVEPWRQLRGAVGGRGRAGAEAGGRQLVLQGQAAVAEEAPASEVIYGGFMVDLWWIYGRFIVIYGGFMVDL